MGSAHSEEHLDPGEWWACDNPERDPTRLGACFHSECRPCMIALAAAAYATPEAEVVRMKEGDQVGRETLLEAFDSERDAHDLPPLLLRR